MKKALNIYAVVFVLALLLPLCPYAQERGSGKVIRYYEAGLSSGRLSLYYASVSGTTVSTSQPWLLYYRYYLSRTVTAGLEVGIEQLTTTTHNLYCTIAPEITVAYYDHTPVSARVYKKLYGGISLGLVSVSPHSAEPPNYSTWSGNKNAPALQLTLIGLSVGKQISGFGELGIGYKGMFNLGVNVRFQR